MKESYIEKICIALAKKEGYTIRKIKYIAQNGAPDRMFFKLGHFMFVEFKTEGGIISELQKYQQKLLKDAGLEVHNIWNIDEFIKIIK